MKTMLERSVKVFAVRDVLSRFTDYYKQEGDQEVFLIGLGDNFVERAPEWVVIRAVENALKLSYGEVVDAE